MGTILAPIREVCFKDYMVTYEESLEQCPAYIRRFTTLAFIILVVNIY